MVSQKQFFVLLVICNSDSMSNKLIFAGRLLHIISLTLRFLPASWQSRIKLLSKLIKHLHESRFSLKRKIINFLFCRISAQNDYKESIKFASCRLKWMHGIKAITKSNNTIFMTFLSTPNRSNERWVRENEKKTYTRTQSYKIIIFICHHNSLLRARTVSLSNLIER